MNFALFIPARYESSRFPGKPLVDILGKTLIERVWEKCREAVNPEKIYVLTDDSRIAAHCEQKGIQFLITPSTCLTGTDRVFEASKQVNVDVYINVQGDEPLLSPDDIQKVLKASQKNPESIINAMCSIELESDFRSSSVPKVVATPEGRLLYMSRGAIPTDKKLSFKNAKKQVCIYAFPKQQLSAYGKLGHKTPLEQIEDIEILRFLELGFSVQMIEVSSSSIAVDYPEDVQRVIEALSATQS